MGHIRAAEAIAKGIKELNNDIEVKTCDPMGITSPKLQHFFNNSYLFLANYTPLLWGWIYNSRILYSKYSPIRWYVGKIYAKSIKSIIDEFNPNVVVSAHPFIANGMADLKKRKITDIPLVSVPTDYHVHPLGINEYIDLFILPSSEVAIYLKKKNIPEEKIRISGGLPIDPKFFKPQNKDHIRKTLGLEKDLKVVLILCGGFGMGMRNVIKLISSFKDIDFPLQLLVVAGKNENLKAKLSQIAKELKIKTIIFGFIENVEELMEVTDLVVTKPSGMFISEALTKGLPLIFTKAIPGQEEYNVELLLKLGVAIQPKKITEIPSLIVKLFTQKELLQEMEQKINERFANTKPVYNISNILQEVVKK